MEEESLGRGAKTEAVKSPKWYQFLWYQFFAGIFSGKSSLRNLFLAIMIGCLPFIVTWWIVGLFFYFDSPGFVGVETWNYFIRLFVSLFITVMFLKIADRVTEKKNKFTEGVPSALLLTIAIFIFWFFGSENSPRLKDDNRGEVATEEIAEDLNPYRDMTPAFTFVLDAGEETALINHKVGFKMLTYGDKSDYKIIYQGGPTINVISRVPVRYPDLDGRDYKVKIRSNADKQTIYVYYQRS